MSLYHNSMASALTQSIALEEAPEPGILRVSISLISLVTVVFLVWAAFARVEEVAVAPGQIVPSGYIQNIQHLEGGIVQEIFVHEGDIVKKDQPLVRLDATNANADLGQMKARQQTLQLQATRLRMFTGQKSDANTKLTSEEQAILNSMQDARKNQQSILLDQIAQKEKELAALRMTEAAQRKGIELKTQENNILSTSVAEGSSSKLVQLTSQRELNDLQRQLSDTISMQGQAQSAVAEFKNRLQSLDTDLRQDAMKQLGQTEADLAELNKSIGRQEGAADRTVLTAPVDGIVKGLTVHTLGAVVQSGEVLMEIVPTNEALVVEALISPNDIGNINDGEKVEVKVSAFDFSRFGSVPGILNSVSASTFQDKDNGTFYKARISLQKNYVGENPGKNLVMPGMTVQANIITGEKTIMEYLLKPIKNATEGAFHER